jgi:Chaperone of endosialidase
MKLQNLTHILIGILCIGLLARVEAVVPPPDGGYPNFTTAEGQKALFNLTTGSANTAVGWFSLGSNTEGSFNTATGAGALLFNTADENTAFGAAALLFNATGRKNAAIGAAALLNNIDGDFNTAIGGGALENNTIGFSNTAVGEDALFFNATGNNNTANGGDVLSSNTTGGDNTAIGFAALLHNTTGSFNIALGGGAGLSLTTGDSNIDIGNAGVAAESNTIRIGSTQTRAFIAGIHNVNQGGTPLAVTINASGQLGTQAPSSRRFKKEIKPMEQASEAILALEPVTFHYKSDATSTPQFGLIAEEVAEINPDLVLRDEKGDIYTVRYEAVNAMLLNEFLKEHRKNEEQQATIARLKSADAKQEATIAKQQKQIEALIAGLQRVSAQFELRALALQTVSNP